MAMRRGRGGVAYEDVKLGTGPGLERGCGVEMRCSLFLRDGRCVQEAKDYAFRLGAREMVAGLEYGIEGMAEGGERRIRAGAHLCYRDKGVPGLIPPHAALEFQVSLTRIIWPAAGPKEGA